MPPAPADRLRIVVLGYIVRGPLGGLAWHHLQYVMGLDRLGHDVYFIEDSGDYPSCYDPSRQRTGTDPTYGLRFAERTFTRLQLGRRWAYHDGHTSSWFGPAADQAVELCTTADVVINVSGVNALRPWLLAAPVRILIDTDPVFTQIRHLSDPLVLEQARAHTAFFSFGEAIGSTNQGVPDDGIRWRPTRQPIVLDAWPVTPGRPEGSFTTVMQWDSYPAVEHRGRRYGLKSDSFDPYLRLPEITGAPLELALGSTSAPRSELAGHGWTVRDPLEVTRSPWTYQRYIRDSKAEFSIAKHGYVATRCGWFSERSAAYLASGRPVVVQDTGFGGVLPCGSGLVAFSTPEEAASCLLDIDDRYRWHCRAARDVAESHFGAEGVLDRLLELACGTHSAG